MRFSARHVSYSVILVLLWGCSTEDVRTPAERLEAAGEQAGQLLRQVREAEAAFRHTDALALADSLIRVAPDLPEGHFHRGFVLLKLYQLESADESFARAAELDPYHRGALYQRGHVAFEQGKYREAASRYLQQRDVILKSPSRLKEFHRTYDVTALPQTWLQVGRAYQLLYQPDSAMMAYGRVLDLDSTHAQANAWMADLYDQEGDTDRALAHARRAWESERQNADYTYMLGTLLFRNGNLNDALPMLEWTASVQPWNAGVHYNLGRALVAMGRTDEGTRHLEVTNFLQDLDQEIDQARAAAARFPNDPARWRAVANLLGRAGRTMEQRETLSVARSVAERAAREQAEAEQVAPGS